MLKDGKDDAKFLEQVTYLKGKEWEIKGRKVPGAISIPKTRGSKGYEGSERIKYKGGFQIRHYAAEANRPAGLNPSSSPNANPVRR